MGTCIHFEAGNGGADVANGVSDDERTVLRALDAAQGRSAQELALLSKVLGSDLARIQAALAALAGRGAARVVVDGGGGREAWDVPYVRTPAGDAARRAAPARGGRPTEPRRAASPPPRSGGRPGPTARRRPRRPARARCPRPRRQRSPRARCAPGAALSRDPRSS